MYRVVTDPDAADQIVALPDELLPVYLQVLAFGPDGRRIVVYPVLEEQRRVDVLRVRWFG